MLNDVSVLEIIFIFSGCSLTYDKSSKTLAKLEFSFVIVGLQCSDEMSVT